VIMMIWQGIQVTASGVDVLWNCHQLHESCHRAQSEDSTENEYDTRSTKAKREDEDETQSGSSKGGSDEECKG